MNDSPLFMVISILLLGALCLSVAWLDDRLDDQEAVIEKLVKIHPECAHAHQD